MSSLPGYLTEGQRQAAMAELSLRSKGMVIMCVDQGAGAYLVMDGAGGKFSNYEATMLWVHLTDELVSMGALPPNVVSPQAVPLLKHALAIMKKERSL